MGGPIRQLAAFLGLSARTVQHWRAQGKAPAWGMRLLIQAATGCPAGAPGGSDSRWNGWRFLHVEVTDFDKPGPRGGRGGIKYFDWVLVSPTGKHWSPDQLEFLGRELGRIAELEREVQRLRGPAQYLLPLE